MLSEGFKNFIRRILQPITRFFIFLHITPNRMTFIGLIISLISGILYALGHFIIAAIVLIIGGIADTFDGEIARKTNNITKFGTFFDSTTDRFNEFFVLAGIFYFYYNNNISGIYIYAIILSIFFSIMISYTRARAEGLGVSIKRGIMSRVERVVFIILISFLPLKFFNYMIIFFTILNFITVIERIILIKHNLKEVD